MMDQRIRKAIKHSLSLFSSACGLVVKKGFAAAAANE